MNTKLAPFCFRFFAALAAFVLLPLIVVSFTQTALAQAATDPAVPAIADTAAAVATPFIVSFAQSHPWLLSILAAIATLRLVFKPLVSVAEAYIKSTPSTADDEWLVRAEASRAWKIAAWLLDYLGSIKVGPQFTAKPAAKPQD